MSCERENAVNKTTQTGEEKDDEFVVYAFRALADYLDQAFKREMSLEERVEGALHAFYVKGFEDYQRARMSATSSESSKAKEG